MVRPVQNLEMSLPNQKLLNQYLRNSKVETRAVLLEADVLLFQAVSVLGGSLATTNLPRTRRKNR